MRICALDLSLTGTGVARNFPDGEFFLGTLTTKLEGWYRFEWMIQNVTRHAKDAELVVIEGLSFGHNLPSAQERSGVWYNVAFWLWQAKIQTLVVPPSTLKKFVTGKGSSEKSVMLRETFRHWNVIAANDNEADAAGLLHVGLAYCGAEECSNQAQRDVLATLRKSHGAPQVKVEAAAW